MANVKASKVGYYDHRRIKEGETFEMVEVDESGFYVDEKGKRAKFKIKELKDGKLVDSDKTEERKCRWVVHVNSKVGSVVDAKEVAAVLSGKNPGKSKKV